MWKYFEYVNDNYLSRVRIPKELFIYLMFFVALSAGLMYFMPETFIPVFRNTISLAFTIVIAMGAVVFLALAAIFLYKTFDEFRKEQMFQKNSFRRDDDDEEEDERPTRNRIVKRS